MNELKVCPFCGCAPYSVEMKDRFITIGCNECAIEFTEDETEYAHKWPDALAAWNTRAFDVDAVLRIADKLDSIGKLAYSAIQEGEIQGAASWRGTLGLIARNAMDHSAALRKACGKEGV